MPRRAVKQWPKNMLVFAAPVVADVLTRPSVLARVGLAFAAFCVLASGVYLLNDVQDAAEDRRHPVKQHRPVAAGAIGKRTAAIVGAGLLLAALSVTLLASWAPFAIAGGYVLLNAAYTGWLRGRRGFDLGLVRRCRNVRGPVRGWRLTSLRADRPGFAPIASGAGQIHAWLLAPRCRRRVRRGAGGVRHPGFESAHAAGVPWCEITIVAFMIALLRYGLLISRGAASTPEEVLIEDAVIKLTGVTWLVTFGLAI